MPLVSKAARRPSNRATIVAPERYREFAYRPTDDGWSPDGVKAALAAADSGQLTQLADLCETIMADDRVDGVLDTRTHGLLGLPLSFAAGSEEMRALLSGVDGAPGEWWRQHQESELVKLLRWGVIAGFGLAQRVPLPYVRGTPQRYRLETWSPRWLSYNDAAKEGHSEWSVQTADGYIPILPGAGQWILFTPYGVRRPWADGKWRRLAFPWLLKRFALEDRANMGEVFGNPTWIGKAPKGSNERQRQRYLSQLVSLGKKGKIVIPEDWDLVLREATGRTWEIFSEAITWADAAITIVLAGQIVTTEGSQGFASGNVQERIVGDLIRFDAESLSTCLFEQSLTPLARTLYGDANAAPWPVWDTKRPPDKEQDARTYEIVGRAVHDLDRALAADGLRVDIKSVCETLGIPLVKVPKDEARPVERIALAPTDVARAVTLNEVRANNGLPPLVLPDGSPDPKGDRLMSDLIIDEPIDPAPDATEEPVE